MDVRIMHAYGSGLGFPVACHSSGLDASGAGL